MIRSVIASVISGLVIAVVASWLWVGANPTSGLILGRGWERYGEITFLAGLAHGLLIAIATMQVAFRVEAKREEAYPIRQQAPATVKVGIPLLIAAVILVTAVLPVMLFGLVP
ncbi:MAG: hypothetical protein Q4G51_00945 [Dermatophilus congolensis]|nr:hypothetical protein [Dermatophilus congolensis]